MKRTLQGMFVPVYRDLMDVPEYVRYFQSRTIGSMYILLVSRIWRRRRGQGYFGLLGLLSQHYQDGSLCTSITDDELVDLLGVSIRHVRRMRTQLVELGLLELIKVDRSTVIYKLGVVFAPGEYGTQNEALYIERWLKELEDIEEESDENPPTPSFVLKLRQVLNGEAPAPETPPTPAAPPAVEATPLIQSPPPDDRVDPMPTEAVALFNTQTPEEQEDLYSVWGDVARSWTPRLLGRFLFNASAKHGLDEVKMALAKAAKAEGLNVSSSPLSSLYCAAFVDAWFQKFSPNEKDMTQKIMAWWVALSLDLKRPDLLRNVKQNTIVAGKITGPETWPEFSFLIRQLFNERGGVKFFHGFKHITWLHTAIMQEAYRLSEFRTLSEGLSNIDTSKLMNDNEWRDQVKRDFEADLAKHGISASKGHGNDDDSSVFDEFL